MHRHNVSITLRGMIIQRYSQPGFKGWNRAATAMGFLLFFFSIHFMLAAMWHNQNQLAVLMLPTGSGAKPRPHKHFCNNLA